MEHSFVHACASRKRILLPVLGRERDPLVGKETPLQRTFPRGQFLLKRTSLLHGVDVPGDQYAGGSHRLELLKQRLKGPRIAQRGCSD